MENYTPPTTEYQVENNVAFLLRIIAVVFVVVGVVGSFILGDKMSTTVVVDALKGEFEQQYNWTLALTGIFVSALSGVLLYGFAELISLQGEAVDELKKISEKLNKAPDTEKTE